MRSGGARVIPPGPALSVGLKQWSSWPGPLGGSSCLAFGVWGRRRGGERCVWVCMCVCVCMCVSDSFWGYPLGDEKEAGVRRLRVDGECGQRSTWARAEFPKSAESRAG